MSAGVELDHITVRFGDFTAVKDATLDIKGGEFFSFLGPSGCGKTTILRTVSGFLDPSEGAVRIGGQDMAGIGPNKHNFDDNVRYEIHVSLGAAAVTGRGP